MKKIITLAVITTILSQIFCFSSYATENGYDYFFEGENPTSSNWEVINATSSVNYVIQASNNNDYELYTNRDPEYSKIGYYAEYSIIVEEGGIYSFDACMTPPSNADWASDVYLKVNNQTEKKLEGKMFESVTDKLNWYHLGALNLNSGNNTLRFIVKEKATLNYYTAFLDCFGLKKDTFHMESISSLAPFNVFESGNNVILNLNTNIQAFSASSFPWTVKDYKGNQISNGTAQFSVGYSSVSVNLGTLAKGYYEITAGGITSGFSVVKPLSERVTYNDTPFAADTNFTGIVLGANLKNSAEDYAKVLALSGVSWIRDRNWIKNYTTKDGDMYQFANSQHSKTAELVKKYGIKVSTVAEYMPDEIKNQSDYYIPTNLIETYKYWKQVAEAYDGKVDNWEILNETDFGGAVTSFDSPDLYSAFFKAASLAVSDAETTNTTTTTIQGSSSEISNAFEYVDNLTNNDVLKFSGADNIHSHIQADDVNKKYFSFKGSNDIKNHITKQATIENEVPIWVTEAGISLNGYSIQEQQIQAKYLVTSTVESISSGTDKHFFFIGPYYKEGEKYWGMMSDAGKEEPYMYASLSAQSAMTDILGKGEYRGMLLGLDNDVHAYSFYNGNKYVVILYTEGQDKTIDISRCGTALAVYDMFGNEVSANISSLDINSEPCYVVFNSEPLNFTSERRAMITVLNPATPTDAEHVVLLPKFPDAEKGGSRTDGYILLGNTTEITLDVVNLSNKTMTGTVSGSFKNGWDLLNSRKNVSIPALSSKQLTFQIKANNCISKDYLTFVGEFDGNKTTVSQSIVKTRNDDIIVYEAEDSFTYDQAYEPYTKGEDSGIGILTESIRPYEVSVDAKVPKEGLYTMQILGAINGFVWSSDYDVYVNNIKYEVEKYTNSEPAYWAGKYALDWNTVKNVPLQQGNNTIKFITSKVRNNGDQYIVSVFDKIALIPNETNNTWMEAEEYSKKSGLYYSEKNGTAMTLYTSGINNPYTDNYLKYNFSNQHEGKYDVWIKSSTPNVDYLTKWKWGLNKDSEDCEVPTVIETIASDTIVQGRSIKWYLVSSNTTIKEGLNSITVVGDAKRKDNDYMFHIIDSIAISKTGSWTPTGNEIQDKAEFAKANLLAHIDTERVTGNIFLPTTFENMQITWTSDNIDVVSAAGVVTRPRCGDGNIKVTLTANITCGEYNTQGQYEITVLEKPAHTETEVTLYNSDDEEINEFEAYTKVAAKFINETGSKMTVQVYCTSFDKFTNELIDVQKDEIKVDAHESGTKVFDFSVNANNAHRNVLKIFTWDNMLPRSSVSQFNGKYALLNSPVIINNNVIISGNTGKANERLAVVVLKETDKDYEEMNGNELATSLEYVGEVVTNSNGKYYFSFKANDVEALYSVRIGGYFTDMVEELVVK